jgi:hypothetical protein
MVFNKKGPSTEGKVGIEKSGLQLLYVCNMKRRLVIWTFGNWMFCNWTFVTGRLVTERFVDVLVPYKEWNEMKHFKKLNYLQ